LQGAEGCAGGEVHAQRALNTLLIFGLEAGSEGGVNRAQLSVKLLHFTRFNTFSEALTHLF
jgi:hypothetical protein